MRLGKIKGRLVWNIVLRKKFGTSDDIVENILNLLLISLNNDRSNSDPCVYGDS